ncbi:MAG TPA: phage integrase SAM-like domain-containing protein, partial [Gemmatimonadaceae bacterium]
MGTIQKRGKDRYRVRVYVGRDAKGKRQYINQTVRGKKGDADAVLTDLLGKRQSGTLAVRPRVVLDDFLDTWLEEKAIKRRARTLHSYRQVLDLYVRPHLGALHLTQIDEQAICGMLTKLRKQGLGPRSIRKAHEVLRNALQSATNKKLIPSNPAKSEVVLEVLPEKPSTERTTVPVDKMRDVVEAASNDRLAAYWMVLLFGGLRPSEALALRWEDYRNKAVTIKRTLTDKNGLPLEFAPTKTKKSVREVV